MANLDYNAKVIGKMEFAPGNFLLKVAPLEGQLPDFVSGQYGVLGLRGDATRSPLADKEEKDMEDPSKLIRRAYSIASSAISKDHVEFYISMVRSGALTPRLYNLNLGDKLWMGKKFVGMFTLEDIPKESNVVLIATGTGLAPYMSMIRTLVTSGEGFNRKYAVIHGARHSWDLGYQAELQTLERISENFNYIPVVSSPEEEQISWSGARGFVADVWHGDDFKKRWNGHPIKDDTHIYLCGNPLMIDSAMEFLTDEGFKKHSRKESGEVHLEEYW